MLIIMWHAKAAKCNMYAYSVSGHNMISWAENQCVVSVASSPAVLTPYQIIDSRYELDWYIIYYNNTNNLYFYHNQYMKDILKMDTFTLIERIIDEYVVGMKYENKGKKG